MGSTATKRMTLAEFLDWEDGTDTRYELIAGRPVAMAPALQGHNRLVIRLATLINSRLRPPCVALVNSGLLSPLEGNTFFLPDILVTCAPSRPGLHHAEDPILAAEILSPSTKGVDTVVKLQAYSDIPSVRTILHVWTTARRVTLYRRDEGGWHMRTFVGNADLPIEPPIGPISLASLYDGIALEDWA